MTSEWSKSQKCHHLELYRCYLISKRRKINLTKKPKEEQRERRRTLVVVTRRRKSLHMMKVNSRFLNHLISQLIWKKQVQSISLTMIGMISLYSKYLASMEPFKDQKRTQSMTLCLHLQSQRKKKL